MGNVVNGERVTRTRWGISFSYPSADTETNRFEPYELFDTYEEALAAFEGMKLKHQMQECIIRLETTYTEVWNGDHIRPEDVYG